GPERASAAENEIALSERARRLDSTNPSAGRSHRARPAVVFPRIRRDLPRSRVSEGEPMSRWILAPLALALLGIDSRVLGSFPREKVEIGAWMKSNGWESKREDPSRFEVGDGVLHLVSAKDSVMIGTERGFPIDCRTTPWLRVRFRIGKIPTGTNLSKKS